MTGLFWVPCPCCKGVTMLFEFDPDDLDGPPTEHECSHCDGQGRIRAEVPDPDDIPRVVPKWRRAS